MSEHDQRKELTSEECDALVAQMKKGIRVGETKPRDEHICCQAIAAFFDQAGDAADRPIPEERREELIDLVFRAATLLSRPHMDRDAHLFLHRLWGGREAVVAKLAEYRLANPTHKLFTVSCDCEFVLPYHVVDVDALDERFKDDPSIQ